MYTTGAERQEGLQLPALEVYKIGLPNPKGPCISGFGKITLLQIQGFSFEICWESASGGGGAKRIVQFFGGERTIECPLQSQFWRHQKVGFVWSVPVFSKAGREQTGGGNVSEVGGSKTVFWGGVLWYVFPSPECSPPPFFCFLNLEGA